MADALGLRIGMPFFQTGPAAAFSNLTFDADGDQWEAICQAPAALTITKIGFRIATVAGTSPVYMASIQGVDSSGNPDGTVKGGGSPSSATFQPSALGWTGPSWHWVTLDNSYTTARGEDIALVVARDSGTVASETFTIGLNQAAQFPGFPLNITNNNGSRTKWVRQPVFGFATATKAYGWPLLSETNITFNSDTTPDEIGIKFTLPADWGDTFKVAGVHFYGSGNAGDTLTFTLYDSDGSTTLQSVDLEADFTSQIGSMTHLFRYFDEATLSTLNFGTAYRLAVKTDVNENCLGLTMDVDAAGDMDAYPLGQNCVYTHRADSGSWTDVATSRLFMDLILDDITEPAGGSGGIIFPVGSGLVY